jgi:hypothetical protein
MWNNASGGKAPSDMGRRARKFNHSQVVIARLDRAIQYAAAFMA